MFMCCFIFSWCCGTGDVHFINEQISRIESEKFGKTTLARYGSSARPILHVCMYASLSHKTNAELQRANGEVANVYPKLKVVGATRTRLSCAAQRCPLEAGHPAGAVL